MQFDRFLIPSALIGLSVIAGCAGAGNTIDEGSGGAAATSSDVRPRIGKPYAEVVTNEFSTDDGFITTHMNADGKLLFELPKDVLGTELLMVSRIAKLPQNLVFGGAGMKARGQQVVRFDTLNNNILLRHVSYEGVASDSLPIYRAVRYNHFEPVVHTFPIEALNDSTDGFVIDATGFFTSDIPLISGLGAGLRQANQVRRLDGQRSQVVSAKSYPLNTEVRHILTFDAGSPPSHQASSTISLEMNQSIIALPERPMKPRYYDPRVGFYSVQQIDYGEDTQGVDPRRMITRWRLEPSDPVAYARGELVEPVKPIVYYIDDATPEKWRPYLKQGVEDWNEAFEAAGFRNAITARDAPTPEEDPEYSPEDIRYSVIRYITNPIQNAQGPHVHDPRTGEILESDILWYHNIQALLRSWFIIQTAGYREEARAPRLPDEIMGELIRYVSAHEVGHTLGFPHNWGASSAYPVDSLRSATFTERMGVSPSIMDYSRFNYVRQPEDRDVPFATKIGPYDRHAAEWGYRVFPETMTPDEERERLDDWLEPRTANPLYFYGRQTAIPAQVDPRSQREDIGDDPVRASGYGIENLKRVTDGLLDWTHDEGAGYDDLENHYNSLLYHFSLYVEHVARLVGGVYETPKMMGQSGRVYEPVERVRQEEAMDFLDRHVYRTPEWLLNEEILRRIEQDGGINRMIGIRMGVTNLLLNPGRLARMAEYAEISESRGRSRDDTSAGAPFGPHDLMSRLQDLVWHSLSENAAISVHDRALQRGYVERLAWLLTVEQNDLDELGSAYNGYTSVNASLSDVRALARYYLDDSLERVQASGHSGRPVERSAHVADLIGRIEAALDTTGS